MRILAISNHYPPFHAGGYGVLSYRLCECLRQVGHEVTVLTSVPKDSHPHPGGHQVDLPVFRELRFVDGAQAGWLLLLSWLNHRAVRRHIRERKPDLVYCFGNDGVGYQVYHTAVESGVPSVTVVGDTWLAQAWRDLPRYDRWSAFAVGFHTNGALRVLKRMIGCVGQLMGLYVGTKPRAPHPIFAISTFLKNDLIDAGFSRSECCRLVKYPLVAPFVKPDGAPIGKDGSSSPSLRVLFLSRMEPLKGPDLAIKGVAGALSRGVDVALTLAGMGAEGMKKELRRLASELGVADRVVWQEPPTQAALVALYRAHDVFVFPSRIVEGLGIVCLEAMACGLPVLATRAGGQLDLVKEGETGFTFMINDDKELSAKLAELAADRALLNKLSRGAMEMAKSYNVATVTQLLDEWTKDVVLSHTLHANQAPSGSRCVMEREALGGRSSTEPRQ